MQYLYLYSSNGITHKHRLINQSVLVGLMDKYDLSMLLDGCFINDNTEYIDVNLGLTDPLLLQKMSYGRVVSFDTHYLFFIDRIETNNFSGVYDEETELYRNRSFRLYITIDWWSTMLYRHGNNIYPMVVDKLSGDVERANVNDVEYDGTHFRPTLSNTFLSREEEVTDYIVRGGTIAFNDLASIKDNIQWLYILHTLHDTRANQTVCVGDVTSPIRYSCPCRLSFAAIQNGRTFPMFVDTIEGEMEYGPTSNVPANSLTDKNVIHSFISQIPPAQYELIDTEEHGRAVRLYGYSDGSRIRKVEFTPLNIVGSESASFPSIPLYEGLTNSVAQLSFLTNARLSYNSIRDKPPTYHAYKSYIVKPQSQVYKSVSISNGQEIFPLPFVYGNEMRIGISIENGGVIVSFPTRPNVAGYHQQFFVGDDCTFEPYQRVDRFKVFSGIWGAGTSLVSGSMSGAKSAGGVGAALGALGSLGNSIATIAENSRGIISSQPCGIKQVMRCGTPQYLIMDTMNDENITEKLMIYGYNTPLTIREILNNHKRKYFNYIKVNKADLSATDFTENVRSSIEEMFNNGVWLWNNIIATAGDTEDGVARENAMGYLYLNNYPLIYEE